MHAQAAGYDIVIENIMAFPLFLPYAVGQTPLLALNHHFEGTAFIHSQGLIKGLFGMFLENIMQPLVHRRTPFVVVSELTRDMLESRWLRPRAEVAIVPPGIQPMQPAPGVSRADRPTVTY